MPTPLSSQDPTVEASVNLNKTRDLAATLDAARSTYLACLFLIISPRNPMSDVRQFLDNQMALAVAVPLRVRRISVMSAVESAKQMLAVHQMIPENGLV
jgi:peptide subunit release factor 1 (eRF1)